MVETIQTGLYDPAELFIWTDIDPNYEEDFNQWYEREHMLERACIPGFVWARRYRAHQAPRKYLALYRTKQLAVFDSPEYQQAFTQQTQWSLQNFARMRHTVRRVMSVTAVGRAVGTGAAVALVSLADVQQAVQAAHEMGAQTPTGVVSMRILCPDPQRSTPLPSESTQGRVLHPYYVLEGTTLEAVTAAAQQLALNLGLAADAVATFQLLWELRTIDIHLQHERSKE